MTSSSEVTTDRILDVIITTSSTNYCISADNNTYNHGVGSGGEDFRSVKSIPSIVIDSIININNHGGGQITPASSVTESCDDVLHNTVFLYTTVTTPRAGPWEKIVHLEKIDRIQVLSTHEDVPIDCSSSLNVSQILEVEVVLQKKKKRKKLPPPKPPRSRTNLLPAFLSKPSSLVRSQSLTLIKSKRKSIKQFGSMRVYPAVIRVNKLSRSSSEVSNISPDQASDSSSSDHATPSSLASTTPRSEGLKPSASFVMKKSFTIQQKDSDCETRTTTLNFVNEHHGSGSTDRHEAHHGRDDDAPTVLDQRPIAINRKISLKTRTVSKPSLKLKIRSKAKSKSQTSFFNTLPKNFSFKGHDRLNEKKTSEIDHEIDHVVNLVNHDIDDSKKLVNNSNPRSINPLHLDVVYNFSKRYNKEFTFNPPNEEDPETSFVELSCLHKPRGFSRDDSRFLDPVLRDQLKFLELFDDEDEELGATDNKPRLGVLEEGARSATLPASYRQAPFPLVLDVVYDKAEPGLNESDSDESTEYADLSTKSVASLPRDSPRKSNKIRRPGVSLKINRKKTVGSIKIPRYQARKPKLSQRSVSPNLEERLYKTDSTISLESTKLMSNVHEQVIVNDYVLS